MYNIYFLWGVTRQHALQNIERYYRGLAHNDSIYNEDLVLSVIINRQVLVHLVLSLFFLHPIFDFFLFYLSGLVRQKVLGLLRSLFFFFPSGSVGPFSLSFYLGSIRSCLGPIWAPFLSSIVLLPPRERDRSSIDWAFYYYL